MYFLFVRLPVIFKILRCDYDIGDYYSRLLSLREKIISLSGFADETPS